jgi:acyl-coenzyme A synthetase/AMP-(fatty) acid ligase
VSCGQIFFADVMPRTATGKVQRRIVAEVMIAKDNKATGDFNAKL